MSLETVEPELPLQFTMIQVLCVPIYIVSNMSSHLMSSSV